MKRTNIAEASIKLFAATRDRKVNAERCMQTIAQSLAADGDTAGAQAVLEALNNARSPRPTQLLPRPAADVVEWVEPTDLAEELVLDATTGPRIDLLAQELAAAQRFIAHGIDAPTRVLFDGPSGTGKTLATRWLGARLGLPVAIVRLDRVVSSYLGDTARKLAEAFDATKECPSILFLDEIDGLCARRDATSDVPEMRRVTSALLQQLDMLPSAQIVIGATNFRDQVDPALERRLATRISFGLPDLDARVAMVSRWWARVPHDTAAIERIVMATSGMSGAALRVVAMQAARTAIMDGGVVRARHAPDVPHAIGQEGFPA